MIGKLRRRASDDHADVDEPANARALHRLDDPGDQVDVDGLERLASFLALDPGEVDHGVAAPKRLGAERPGVGPGPPRKDADLLPRPAQRRRGVAAQEPGPADQRHDGHGFNI